MLTRLSQSTTEWLLYPTNSAVTVLEPTVPRLLSGLSPRTIRVQPCSRQPLSVSITIYISASLVTSMSLAQQRPHRGDGHPGPLLQRRRLSKRTLMIRQTLRALCGRFAARSPVTTARSPGLLRDTQSFVASECRCLRLSAAAPERP